ncbi:dienelactone hydrolase family protein [Cryphonectria parasitica EP155]|uniref:Dienelactone hydrolase family protein n=1 Tax=Cryphonectria parasitica (strain ATCC 38755 / EP155) TaxID=660469 RepID=A0A9P5CPT4_CRYP1|nr:dienelactone hydrolase family protein [Cryphonectria parasitica EP155]KAF3766503.1 dienelactone hydrolase family protein [Cryphonectria parasitica EP155]
MSIESCCLQGFAWGAEPCGSIGSLADLKTYITGTSDTAAVLIIHDLFGWEFRNTRLLADHYAAEAGVTVYVPDFFDGEILPIQAMLKDEWYKVDVAGFMQTNGRKAREPGVFACARVLRDKYKHVGAVGFCYGGWAAFRLGSREHQHSPLVDCISVGHPSLLAKDDIDQVAVPLQVLAPEHDPAYTAELKAYTFETVTRLGIPFVYRHFPGVAHGCLVRGEENKPHEREALVKGKNAVVGWLKEYLHERT